MNFPLWPVLTVVTEVTPSPIREICGSVLSITLETWLTSSLQAIHQPCVKNFEACSKDL